MGMDENEAPQRTRLLVLGGGYYVRSNEVVAILRFHSGIGSQAVRNLVDATKESWEATKSGPRVWDLTGKKTRRAVVVTSNGDLFITWVNAKTLLNRLLS